MIQVKIKIIAFISTLATFPKAMQQIAFAFLYMGITHSSCCIKV